MPLRGCVSGRPVFKARGVLRTQGEKETPLSIKKSRLSWRGLTSGEPYSKKPSFWVKCQLYVYSPTLLRITQQRPSLHGRRKDEGTGQHLGQKQKPSAARKTLGNCASTPFSAQQRERSQSHILLGCI